MKLYTNRVYFEPVRALLSAIYLSMILLAGLRPSSFNHPFSKVFLDMNRFNGSDLLLNTVGFIPFGFLLMLSFGERSYFKRTMAVAGFGTLISFLLETSQFYFIPGRVSSMIDLITNIIGTLFGIALFFLMEKSNEHRTAVFVQKEPGLRRAK